LRNRSRAASRFSTISAAISSAAAAGQGLQTVVFQPEYIEIDLVALDEVRVVVAAEAFAFLALGAVLGTVNGEKIVQIGGL